MTDADNRVSTTEPDQFLKRFVVITIILVSSVIALAVIFAVILLPAFGVSQAPEELKNWGGLIIGFYFGTFLGLLKDWLSVPPPAIATSVNPTSSGLAPTFAPVPTNPDAENLAEANLKGEHAS